MDPNTKTPNPTQTPTGVGTMPTEPVVPIVPEPAAPEGTPVVPADVSGGVSPVPQETPEEPQGMGAVSGGPAATGDVTQPATPSPLGGMPPAESEDEGTGGQGPAATGSV